MQLKDFQIIEINEVDSTQLFLKNKIINGEPLSNQILIAKNQYSGIGRSNTRWFSFDGCLCFSILTKLEVDFNLQRKILSSLCSLLISKNIKAFIKWPNDIFIQNHKVCGILIDRICDFYIIGIGINLKNFYNNYKSIYELSGVIIDRNSIFEAVINSFFIDKFDDALYNFPRFLSYQDKIYKFENFQNEFLVLLDKNGKKHLFSEKMFSYDFFTNKIIQKI
ncbi:hypothetical protein GVAV_002812 [Gurleya vavrai]